MVWPGFGFLAKHCIWVEFVVGSPPCSEGFAITLVKLKDMNVFFLECFLEMQPEEE